jgi:hypothetical protein
MRSEDGRFDCSPEEIVDVDDPDFVRKVNAAWARMAEAYGLLNQEREFLIMVDCRGSASAQKHSWIRVRLHEIWDIAGHGGELLRSAFASTLTSRYVPEFTVLSVDHRVLMSTTVWGNGTVSTIAVRPDLLAR